MFITQFLFNHSYNHTILRANNPCDQQKPVKMRRAVPFGWTPRIAPVKSWTHSRCRGCRSKTRCQSRACAGVVSVTKRA